MELTPIGNTDEDKWLSLMMFALNMGIKSTPEFLDSDQYDIQYDGPLPLWAAYAKRSLTPTHFRLSRYSNINPPILVADWSVSVPSLDFYVSTELTVGENFSEVNLNLMESPLSKPYLSLLIKENEDGDIRMAHPALDKDGELELFFAILASNKYYSSND